MPQPKPNSFTDFFFPLFGALMVAGGCFWAYRPLGLISLGLLLLSAAFLGKRSK